MSFQTKSLKEFLSGVWGFSFSLLCFLVIALFPEFPALADHPLLLRSVIEYNTGVHEKSLKNGSYKGGEGILRIDPEVGRSLGLNVLINHNYLEAKASLRRADKAFEEAIEVMTTQEKERSPGGHVERIAQLALEHNELVKSARKQLMDYRAELSLNNDERLNRNICSGLLEKLLTQSLKEASNNLRDGLAHFYNLCQDINAHDAPLNSKNVRFVNYVFDEFTKKASKEDRDLFDLDRTPRSKGAVPSSGWNYALGRSASQYVVFVRPLTEEQNKSAYPVSLLLFFALMRQESNFNPYAVSRVGAAGLTQIMPSTAKGLGMNNVFMPAYFKEAGSIMARERNFRRTARGLLTKINEENMTGYAKRARSLMQKSLDFKRKRIKLYNLYRRELLSGRTDDRLNPQKAIAHGFRFFAGLMQKQKGDVSLALASYNAGPHRVKQYNGIPPYDETVGFRNGVLRYYREYRRKLIKFKGLYD